ncbi:MAG: helix-turn-helix domain-containing protein [Almyronema sp.]
MLIFSQDKMTDSEMITVSEAAELSGYTPQHVRLLIRQGLISARRAGGIWLVEASSLKSYLDKAPKPGPKSDNLQS